MHVCEYDRQSLYQKNPVMQVLNICTIYIILCTSTCTCTFHQVAVRKRICDACTIVYTWNRLMMMTLTYTPIQCTHMDVDHHTTLVRTIRNNGTQTATAKSFEDRVVKSIIICIVHLP
jgi:hypothetical protein